MKVSVLCVALLACLAMAPSQASARKLQQTITDVDILNLALNLEYLEVSSFASCGRCYACSMATVRFAIHTSHRDRAMHRAELVIVCPRVAAL
jgi:hypothetical protein